MDPSDTVPGLVLSSPFFVFSIEERGGNKSKEEGGNRNDREVREDEAENGTVTVACNVQHVGRDRMGPARENHRRGALAAQGRTRSSELERLMCINTVVG
ncbi:hypothetical protein BGZ63DRAFT_390433 [Mariannaea sp. PMI_226]|nr:hypothetical protein BGZ63DRAFT_390433 [Mariannaea sp. PMI_226]